MMNHYSVINDMPARTPPPPTSRVAHKEKMEMEKRAATSIAAAEKSRIYYLAPLIFFSRVVVAHSLQDLFLFFVVVID